MSQKKIPFTKGFSLYIESNLEEICNPQNNNIDPFIDYLSSEKIDEVIILPDLRGKSGTEIKEFYQKLKSKGIKSIYLEMDKIRKKDFEYYRKFSIYLNKILKWRNTIILYPSYMEEETHPFLASSLMAGSISTISPDQAIYMITGNKPQNVQTDFRSVFEFSDFLKSSVKSTKSARSEIPEIIRPDFRSSPFTIRFKLLTLVTLIVITSLTIMITMATNLFREHSETLIQEYNLSLARLTGLKISSDLKELTFHMQILADSMKSNPRESQNAVEQFFNVNKSFIYMATAVKSDDKKFSITSYHTNQTLLKTLTIQQFQIDNSLKTKSDLFSRAFSGATILENFSNEFKKPVLAIALPYKDKNSILIGLIESTVILDAFQAIRQSEIFEIYILNGKGEIVIHSDQQKTIQKPDVSEVPIVKQVLKSTLKNGSQKYKYKNKEYLSSFQILDFGSLGIVSTAESDRVFEAVYKIQRQNILIMIIILSLAFLLVYFMARTLSIPILNLLGATRLVEEGNFDVQIKPTTRDEIGLLTNSFIGMARGLKEREHIKDVFGKFVNTHIAEKALRGELQLGGERKKCTVLFTDLRGFTAISESLEPEDLLRDLNEYFTAMVECIYSRDGIVDKFIGDAIMAHWGAVATGEDDTLNAVRAAVAMRKALKIYNMNARERCHVPFQFGCGINTGQVIAGQIGSDKKLEFTVIGDAVNLASRIEYLNKEFNTDILISDSTKKELEHLINTVPMAPIKIRGKREEQILHTLLGFKDDPDCYKTLEELQKDIRID